MCPDPPAAASAHWSVPNPSEMHPPDLDAYRMTARELRSRIGHLLALLAAPRG
jgi:hypothetical protein